MAATYSGLKPYRQASDMRADRESSFSKTDQVWKRKILQKFEERLVILGKSKNVPSGRDYTPRSDSLTGQFFGAVLLVTNIRRVVRILIRNLKGGTQE